jgi:hypothetical protein
MDGCVEQTSWGPPRYVAARLDVPPQPSRYKKKKKKGNVSPLASLPISISGHHKESLIRESILPIAPLIKCDSERSGGPVAGITPRRPRPADRPLGPSGPDSYHPTHPPPTAATTLFLHCPIDPMDLA